MIRSTRPFLLLAMLLAGSTTAHSFLRVRHEDVTVVERSELIVAGRLTRESIRQVLHEQRRPDEGQSWEYHATLVITEVLKGKAPGKEMPIVIHYGLTPTRKVVQHGLGPDSPRQEVGPIGMYDTGNSAVSFSPLIEDVEAENLWFLRRRSGLYGEEPGTGSYGIVDPEDIQPLAWRDYFLAFLAADPEGAVAEYARKNPQSSYRAKQYLDRMEVQRIRKIKDPGERCDKLLPYFLSRTPQDGGWWEARTGLIFCGPLTGARLKAVFLDPKHRKLRQEIISLWSDMPYQEAAPFLIKLLEKHNGSRQAQRLEREGLKNDDSEETEEIIGEVLYSVRALRVLQDQRAKVALEATRDRWKKIISGAQIVEECEAELHNLSQLAGAGGRSQS